MQSPAAPSAGVKFWESIIAKDRDAAHRFGSSLVVPPIEASPFTFDEDSPRSGESVETGVLVGGGTSAVGESAASTPRLLMSDTPDGTVSAWNSDNDVKVVVVNSADVCGIRVNAKGVRDYMVCALPLVGDDRCTVDAHEKRRVKSGLDIALPLGGTPGLAIRVRVSSQSVARRVFSRPILPFTDFPIDMRGDDVMGILTSLEFPARVWKLLFEVHEGYDWMERLSHPSGLPVSSLPALQIPSPRAGEGGYDPSGFDDYDDDDDDTPGDGGQGVTVPPPPMDSNPNPPQSTHHPSNTSARESGGNSVHQSFSTAREEGLNSPPPVFSSRVNATEGRFGSVEVPDDLSSALTMDPDTRVLRGSVESLKGRCRFLEKIIKDRDNANAISFQTMRAEMDEVWDAVHAANAASAEAVSLGGDAMTRANNALNTPHSTASLARDMSSILEHMRSDDVFRRHLAKLVLDDMDETNFITVAVLEDKLSRVSSAHLPPPSVSPAELSGVATRLAKVEQALFKPEGVMAALGARVKLMENRKHSSSISRGNQVFKDQQAVQAFVVASGDATIYRFVVDMVSLLTLAPDPYFTVAEGMANEAAATKAKFSSLLEARIALSYPITFPASVMSKSTATGGDRGHLDLTNGWKWNHAWSSASKFEGLFNNGGFDIMLADLKDTRETLQNSIDASFPIDTHGTLHAIFSEQLSISYQQAVGWLQSLIPLFKTMKSGGLTNEDAWTRVLVYSKALFEDVKTVRHLSADTRSCAAMIWGSLRTADLLAEYSRLRWIQHPQVSSILALTSMQTEGRALADTVATISTINRELNKLSESWKKLKKENPTLKF